MRLISELPAVAGLALGIVVNGRHYSLHQYMAAWHGHADMLGPSAEVPHVPERSHELGRVSVRVILERFGHGPMREQIMNIVKDSGNCARF
jgi:hypothetical protein